MVGKGHLDVLKSSVAEHAQKDRIIEELQIGLERRSFELAVASEANAAMQAKITRPRTALKAQALSVGVTWLNDLIRG